MKTRERLAYIVLAVMNIGAVCFFPGYVSADLTNLMYETFPVERYAFMEDEKISKYHKDVFDITCVGQFFVAHENPVKKSEPHKRTVTASQDKMAKSQNPQRGREVVIRKSEKGWMLLRSGEPYYVRGVEGQVQLQYLATAAIRSVLGESDQKPKNSWIRRISLVLLCA